MKKLKLLIILALAFVISVSGVKAFVTSSETFDDCINDEASHAPGSIMCVLIDSNANQYYCLENGKNINHNQTYTSSNTIKGTGIACGVLDALNANIISAPTTDGDHPITNFTGYSKDDPNNKYFLLQKYLWAKEGNTTACSKTSSSDETTTLTAGTITAPTNVKLTQQKIGETVYYTGTIDISYSNLIDSKYKVTSSTLPTGQKIYTSSNYTDSVAVNGSTGANKLYIRIPATSITKNSTYTIKLGATYNKSKTTTTTVTLTPYMVVYSNGVTTDQKLGTPGLTRSTSASDKYATDTLSSTITLTVNPVGNLTITKKNEVTNKPMAGIKFKLYNLDNTEAKDGDGNLIGEKVTDSQGKIRIENIPYGEYKIKELEAPIGYTDVVEIDVEIKTLNLERVITNNPIKTVISKKSIADESELEGAHIVIMDMDENIVDEYDSETKPHKVYLGPGKYKLIETVAPEGFEKLETVFSFEIELNGDVTLLDVDSSHMKADENAITIYNDVHVDVPDTASTYSRLLIIAGGLLIMLGSGIITAFIVKNKKANSI